MPILFILGFLAFVGAPALVVETQPDYPAQVHNESYHQVVDGHDTIGSD